MASSVEVYIYFDIALSESQRKIAGEISSLFHQLQKDIGRPLNVKVSASPTSKVGMTHPREE